MRAQLTLAVLLAVVLEAPAALAGPAITSVTPSEGAPAGGTAVVIKGTGFSNNCPICSPPFVEPAVFFGNVAAKSSHFIDSTTIEAVTPAHLPGSTTVTVVQFDSDAASLANGFTFTGLLHESFDAILFPIFTPAVHGAFGSEFHTEALVWNQGATPITLFGIDTNCSLADPPVFPDYPFPLGSNASEVTLFTECSTSTGRLFYLPKGSGKSLAANLRVHDVSRQAESYGVEIPIVREQDFRTDRISLIGIPTDGRFRETLRIYSPHPAASYVTVRIGEGPSFPVALTPGESIFEPSFASLNLPPFAAQLPPQPATFRIVIDPPVEGMPIWAFITVTNNVTQEITTITPQ
jgi:hypothetical protein